MPRKPSPLSGPLALIQKHISNAAPLTDDFLDALSVLPLPLQVTTLRRYYKITQGELAACLHIPQTNVSRLERDGSDHLMSLYWRVAEIFKARVILSPLATKLRPR